MSASIESSATRTVDAVWTPLYVNRRHLDPSRGEPTGLCRGPTKVQKSRACAGCTASPGSRVCVRGPLGTDRPVPIVPGGRIGRRSRRSRSGRGRRQPREAAAVAARGDRRAGRRRAATLTKPAIFSAQAAMARDPALAAPGRGAHRPTSEDAIAAIQAAADELAGQLRASATSCSRRERPTCRRGPPDRAPSCRRRGGGAGRWSAGDRRRRRPGALGHRDAAPRAAARASPWRRARPRRTRRSWRAPTASRRSSGWRAARRRSTRSRRQDGRAGDRRRHGRGGLAPDEAATAASTRAAARSPTARGGRTLAEADLPAPRGRRRGHAAGQHRHARRGGPARRAGGPRRGPLPNRVPVPGTGRRRRRRRSSSPPIARSSRRSRRDPVTIRLLDVGGDKPIPYLPIAAGGEPLPGRPRAPPRPDRA